MTCTDCGAILNRYHRGVKRCYSCERTQLNYEALGREASGGSKKLATLKRLIKDKR